MDDFIIGIYRFVLRLFVIATVVLVIVWLSEMGRFGQRVPFEAIVIGVGFVVGAVMIVGHFITVLALRDAAERQIQLLEQLVATIKQPRGQ